MIRHGDITLIPVAGPPEGAVRVEPTPRGIVLTEGEATGHAHVIADASTAELYRVAGDALAYLHVMVPTPLTHEEHGAVAVGVGWHAVAQKRQYDEAHGWVAVSD